MSDKKTKVLVVGGNMGVSNMFVQAGFALVSELENAELVCFTGGADVSPALYGEPNVKSYNDKDRDVREQAVFEACMAMNIPMVGICRGAQFLNVMSGGRMWQDVDNHAIGNTHQLNCSHTGEIYDVSSTHHQMMRPSEDALVLATAKLSTYKLSGADGLVKMTEKDFDVEVAWYPKTKCLCFQPHPEFFSIGDDCFDYFFTLVGDQLSGRLP